MRVSIEENVVRLVNCRKWRNMRHPYYGDTRVTNLRKSGPNTMSFYLFYIYLFISL